MTTALLFVLAIAISIFVHELAHAIEMHKNFVKIKVFSVGFDLPGIPSLKFNWSKMPGTSIRLCPFLLGGYVRPEKDDFEKDLTRNAICDISGAGVCANMFLAGICLAIACLLTNKGNSLIIGSCGLVIGAVFWFFRSFISRYIFPVLSALLPFIVAVHLYYITSATHNVSLSETVGGPVAIFKMADGAKGSWANMFFYVVDLNLSLVVFNLLPLSTIDGARIVYAWVPKRFNEIATRYKYASTVVLLGFIIFILGKDISGLF